jgi:soluble lytic murein transglycosylase
MSSMPLPLIFSNRRVLGSLSLILGVSAFSLFSQIVRAETPSTAEPTGPLPKVTLREVVEGNLLGIQREPEETRVRVRNSARKYVSWRRGVLTPLEFDAWKKECESKPESDDFCPLILGKDPNEFVDSDEEVQEDSSAAVVLSASAKEVLEAWKKGDASTLRKATPGSLYRALRAFKTWDSLETASAKLLDEGRSAHCANPAMATALAQKAEMFLPEPKYKEIAFKLYEKILDCPVGEHASRGRFRYSLLKIEGGDCKVAEPVLDRLYREGNLEYAARSVYWQSRCAEIRGDRLKVALYKQRLLKESPLSYHSIILNRVEVARLSRVTGTTEPTVLFRSHTQPKLNQWVRAIEGLVAVNADEIARRVVNRTVDVLQKTEPELRLYMGTLGYRVGDTIAQFRLLSSVFRDEPRLISQTTLKLFYPMKNFPLIRKYATETDPYFVAALIRQESGFNPWAKSRAGAMGLMQLMPGTARQMERRVSKRALFLPETNIRLGTRYIAKLVNRYERDAELALAAYNAGAERVDDWVKRYPTDDRMLFLDLIPYKETRDYVALIGRNYYWYNTLYSDVPALPMRPGAKNLGRELAADEPSKKPLLFTLYR